MHKLLLVLPLIILAASCTNNNAAPNANAAAGANASTDATTASGSGDDMYYEYTMASAGKSFNMTGYSKLYVAASGKLRSEMQMVNPAVKTTPPIVSIGSMDKPGQSVFIDDSAKTYSINTIDTSAIAGNDPFKMVSTVTKVGEDKILGFNSVHARIISTKSMGPLGKMTDTIDLWNSPDVPMAPFLRHFMDNNMSKSWTSLMTPAAADQLKQMGCTGFMLRMQTGSKDAGVRMELTKIQKADFAKSLFEIPAGYKEEKQ
jgi:Domain of unknown function (DUF4412)